MSLYGKAYGQSERKLSEEVGATITSAFDDIFSGNLGEGRQRESYESQIANEKEASAKAKGERGKQMQDVASQRNRADMQTETNVARFSMAGKSAFDDDAFTAGAQELDMDGPDF